MLGKNYILFLFFFCFFCKCHFISQSWLFFSHNSDLFSELHNITVNVYLTILKKRQNYDCMLQFFHSFRCIVTLASKKSEHFLDIDIKSCKYLFLFLFSGEIWTSNRKASHLAGKHWAHRDSCVLVEYIIVVWLWLFIIVPVDRDNELGSLWEEQRRCLQGLRGLETNCAMMKLWQVRSSYFPSERGGCVYACLCVWRAHRERKWEAKGSIKEW